MSEPPVELTETREGGAATRCGHCGLMTVTSGEGVCPACWGLKSGAPRYLRLSPPEPLRNSLAAAAWRLVGLVGLFVAAGLVAAGFIVGGPLQIVLIMLGCICGAISLLIIAEG